MAQAITHHGFDDHHEAGRPDPARIGALGATMALNLGALLVLAMPMPRDIGPQALAPPSRPTIVDIVARRDPPPPPPVPTRPVRAAPISVAPAPVVQPPVIIEHGPGPVASIQTDPYTAPAPVTSDTGGAGSATASPVALRYTQAPAPRYPRPALRAGLTGTVWLRVLVDEQGRPVTVEVDQGSGHRVLDDAARRQVLAHWRFQPALADGRPVQAWGRVPIEFKLDR